jgi:hypothetical protein
MLPDKDIGCHHTGFEKGCRELVASGRCARWMQVQGKHPQTNEDLNRWDCIDNFGPLLQIDAIKHTAQATASIDRFNNDMVRMNGIASAVRAIAPPAASGEPQLITVQAVNQS